MLDRMGNFPIGWPGKLAIWQICDARTLSEAKEARDDAIKTAHLGPSEVAWVREIFEGKKRLFTRLQTEEQ